MIILVINYFSCIKSIYVLKESVQFSKKRTSISIWNFLINLKKVVGHDAVIFFSSLVSSMIPPFNKAAR